MTTQEPKEGASVADVLGGTQGATDSTSKEPVSKAELAELEARIGKQIEQGFASVKQSQKDVIGDRINRAVTSLPELRAFSQFLEANPGIVKDGVDPKRLIRDQAVDLIVDRELAGTPAERQAESRDAGPAGAQAAVKAEVDRILETYGVAGDDPEVVALAKEVQGEPLLVQLTKLNELGADIQRRKGGVSAQVGGARGSGNKPDLEAAYRAEMKANRGRGMHVARQIKDKYRRSGLDVDHIDLMA